jgi:hypothetical protein
LAKLVPYWKSHPIEYLVRARYPLGCFPEPTFASSEPLSPGLRAAKEAADAYRKELLALEPAKLAKLIEAQRSAEVDKARQRADAEEKSRYFNLPSAQADYAHWATMSYWTIQEGVALSLARDPKIVALSSMQALANVSPFAQSFVAKYEIANRAKTMGQLWERTTPSIFLAWAERMRFQMPDGLISEVKSLGIQIADWKTLYDQAKAQLAETREEAEGRQRAHIESTSQHAAYLREMQERQSNLIDQYKELLAEKDSAIDSLSRRLEELDQELHKVRLAASSTSKQLGGKERDSLLKLVIGMAIRGYGYDPKAGRSPTAKDIAGDLALVGLPLDEDTVRKYLFEAKELLPGETLDQKD